MNALTLPRTVADMVAEYEAKNAAIPDAIAAFNKACDEIEMAGTVAGSYGGQTFRGGRPSVFESDMRKRLLKSGWKAIWDRLQIDRIASATDKRLFERTIEDPPPLTMDNAVATFGDYLVNARHHILRGLAETFIALDPAYRSHSKVKIGVAGLPKRVILTNVSGYGSWGRDRLRDLINALAAYRGQPLFDHREFEPLDKFAGMFNRKAGDVVMDGSHYIQIRDGVEVRAPDRGITVRVFLNGNAHVIFTPDTLLDVNRALAEFYGDILPDAEPAGVKPKPSTEVAKDLQFYPTPQKVIDWLVNAAGVLRSTEWDKRPELRVLEPSCGDGRVMDEIRLRGHRAFGIEVHAGRSADARIKRHSVLTANFLDQPPVPEFDAVAMNPPFYGTHWAKHIEHALKFLKPGGTLASVLPASAWYDHRDLLPANARWEGLPVASFAEAGTNISTGIVTIIRAG